MKIQHDWAEARVKGDSSYTRQLESEDCTIVWPDGRIVNKQGDLQSMSGDIVFSEFRIHDLQARLWRHWNRRRRGHRQSAEGKTSSSQRKIRMDRHICEAGRSMEGGRFTNHFSLGKMIAHSYP